VWLITGGSGFIGTNFIHFLNNNSYDFKIYDKCKSKYLPKNIEVTLGDIRDKKKLSSAMKDCDVVFHLATVTPSSRLSKNIIYDIDINGMKNVLSNCKKNNVKKLIFTSSASHVYGLIKKNKCPIKENDELNPINEYGRNKIIAEKLCKKFTEETNIKIIILRLSMIMGKYNFDPILVENISRVLKNKRLIIGGNGEHKNQSLHVKDVNLALLKSAEIKNSKLKNNNIFNISSNETPTINQWIATLKKISNSSSKVTHIPLYLLSGFVNFSYLLHQTNIHPSYIKLMAQDQYFDIQKAKKILKWEPKNNVKEAIKDTIKFHKKS
jgi:nucleoside-diphosphate-sugar epimerase